MGQRLKVRCLGWLGNRRLWQFLYDHNLLVAFFISAESVGNTPLFVFCEVGPILDFESGTFELFIPLGSRLFKVGGFDNLCEPYFGGIVLDSTHTTGIWEFVPCRFCLFQRCLDSYVQLSTIFCLRLLKMSPKSPDLRAGRCWC